MNKYELTEDQDNKLHFKALSLGVFKHPAWKLIKEDIHYLLPWLLPYKKKLILCFIFFLISLVSTLLLPRIVGMIIDQSILKTEKPFFTWTIYLIIIFLFKVIFDLIYKWKIVQMGQTISMQIRQGMYQSLHKKDLQFFDINSSGKIISRVVSDVNNLSSFFTTNVFSVISDIVIIFGSFAMILSFSFQSALIVGFFLIILIVYMLNVTVAMIDWSKSIRSQNAKVSIHMTDTMNNLSVLHLHPFSDFWFGRAKRLQAVYGILTFRGIIIWGLFSSFHIFTMGLVLSIVLSLSLYLYSHGEITIGAIVALMSYLTMCFHPFLDISEKLNTLLQALSSVARMKFILPSFENNEDIGQKNETIHTPRINLEIKNLSFAYHEKLILKNININIPLHQMTAIVGRTGSGKSTLVQILMGLYKNYQGEIIWDSYQFKKNTPYQMTKLVGQVNQELFFFEDSLKENLRLFDQSITDSDIYFWLDRFELSEKIKSLPQGLEIKIEKNEMPFSQGEKQLLILIRLLLKKPALLIFDEATAHLDQLAEVRIMKAMEHILKDHTVIMVAHRLASLNLAEQVIVMKDGMIEKSFSKLKGKPVYLNELSKNSSI